MPAVKMKAFQKLADKYGYTFEPIKKSLSGEYYNRFHYQLSKDETVITITPVTHRAAEHYNKNIDTSKKHFIVIYDPKGIRSQRFYASLGEATKKLNNILKVL
jgi:hypothetical protein